jgi:acyl carrier protein
MPVSDEDDRLMRCFASVFSSAAGDEIRTSQFEAISGWDSLKGVMLLAVLDEEFGIQMDVPELLELGSFAAVKEYLSKQGMLARVKE